MLVEHITLVRQSRRLPVVTDCWHTFGPVIQRDRPQTAMTRTMRTDSQELASAKPTRINDSEGGPVLRWAGSKRKLLPILLDCCPGTFKRYIEPFAGSACLFFSLRPPQAILSDFNISLIETYRTLVRAPKAVHRRLAAFPTTERFYYNLRDHADDIKTPTDRAARFIYLNRFCFNGVYRTNRAGQFNVPRGTRTGSIPSLDELVSCSAALKHARLWACDFEKTLSVAGADDFVYLDPPYSHPSGRYRGEYGYGGFGIEDLDRLERALDHLDRRSATFILSYKYSEATRLRFSRWHRRCVLVKRHVAGFAHDRHTVRELMVSNRPIAPRGNR